MLLEERFYGYYLHGKSVHAHADADLLQLNSNLKREEDGLVARRGLEPDSDVQVLRCPPRAMRCIDAAHHPRHRHLPPQAARSPPSPPTLTSPPPLPISCT